MNTMEKLASMGVEGSELENVVALLNTTFPEEIEKEAAAIVELEKTAEAYQVFGYEHGLKLIEEALSDEMPKEASDEETIPVASELLGTDEEYTKEAAAAAGFIFDGFEAALEDVATEIVKEAEGAQAGATMPKEKVEAAKAGIMKRMRERAHAGYAKAKGTMSDAGKKIVETAKAHPKKAIGIGAGLTAAGLAGTYLMGKHKKEAAIDPKHQWDWAKGTGTKVISKLRETIGKHPLKSVAGGMALGAGAGAVGAKAKKD